VPLFYLTMDCDIANSWSRARRSTPQPQGQGKKPLYKLSVNDFVIKALRVALQRIPTPT
jgi:pyruvate dehydrogenase E2 component (dihydrolipoamide acetyltransferase)